MATTITKILTGLNWGSEGIIDGTNIVDNAGVSADDMYDITNNSFTITPSYQYVIRRKFAINKTTVLGQSANLIQVTANFSGYAKNDRETPILIWGYQNVAYTSSNYEDSSVFTTSSANYSLTVKDTVQLDENGDYPIWLGCHGKSFLGNTVYFSNVSFDLTYTVTAYSLTVNAGTGGTVTGGGDYEAGTTATLTATPNDGYKFVKWSDGNTSATRTVTVSADATYTAVFVAGGADSTYIDGEKCSEVWIDGEKCSQLWIDGVKVFG